jgi:hypothetical protein
MRSILLMPVLLPGVSVLNAIAFGSHTVTVLLQAPQGFARTLWSFWYESSIKFSVKRSCFIRGAFSPRDSSASPRFSARLPQGLFLEKHARTGDVPSRYPRCARDKNRRRPDC